MVNVDWKMSLADELLADLEEIGNDFDDDDTEIRVKDEPIDGDEENDQDAVVKMEIDESVSLIKSIFITNC